MDRPSAGTRPRSSARDAGLGEEKLLQRLTPRQREEIHRHWQELQRPGSWSECLPVLLLDRCWLRLSAESLDGLARSLPPDVSAEAPELVRYRQWRRRGLGSWDAQLRCWEEFGTEACREAQQRFWSARERGNRGWTLERYLALRSEYRRRWHQHWPRPLPLLVLARDGASAASGKGPLAEPGGEGEHLLLWLCPGADETNQTMRHTCS